MVGGVLLAVAWLDGGTEPGFRAFAAFGLWIAVTLGLVLGLWPRAPIPRAALVAGLLLGALAALTALSMAWANDNGAAFVEIIRVLAYLGLFVVVVLASSSGGARPWLTGLALGLAATALVAIVARTQPGLIGAAESIREELGVARTRLSFPMEYWNALGTGMALGTVLLSWLGAEARSARGRAAATAVIPMSLLVLLLTSSRGGVVALAVGIVVLLALGRSRPALLGSFGLGTLGGAALITVAFAATPLIATGKLEQAGAGGQGDLLLAVAVLVAAVVATVRYAAEWLQPRATRSLSIAAAVLFLAGAGVGVAALEPVNRVEAFCALPVEGQSLTAHLVDPSGSGRCQFWEVGLDAFASAPMLGIGAGGYESWWAEHHTRPQPVTFAHSLAVGMLAELGVTGFLLVGGFLVTAAVAGVGARRRRVSDSAPAVALAVLAGGTAAAAFDWMWEVPAVFGAVIVACALLTGPGLTRASGTERSRFGFGVVALLVGWAAIVAATLSFFGESRIDGSEEALEAGDLERAVAQAGSASSVLPWDSEPYLLKAAALEGDGDLPGATEAVEAALEREPGEWRIWAVAARIYDKAGEDEKARRARGLARRLNPATGDRSTGS